ncbi:hypothetical protein UY3_13174 [Chelonia mydas]|uniref:Uncharacterized protein n=1 Tax=Chelonia mydas TaxID=8469 RepID=M7AW58_CHEMY|nr:hypothetical protein UY3_13174 [Chelonia mydas]
MKQLFCGSKRWELAGEVELQHTQGRKRSRGSGQSFCEMLVDNLVMFLIHWRQLAEQMTEQKEEEDTDMEVFKVRLDKALAGMI